VVLFLADDRELVDLVFQTARERVGQIPVYG
jgi:hypothetical protein